MIETYPTKPLSLQAVRAKPEGFDSLRRKLIAEQASHIPTLAVYANPPITTSSLLELAERIDCDFEEYAVLLRTQGKIDEDGDVLFPKAPSDTFLRLFPEYKPAQQEEENDQADEVDGADEAEARTSDVDGCGLLHTHPVHDEEAHELYNEEQRALPLKLRTALQAQVAQAELDDEPQTSEVAARTAGGQWA